MQITYTVRVKLIAAFFIMALAPLILVAVLNGRTARQALIDDANQALFAVASQTAASVDNFIAANLNDITTEAGLPALRTYLATPVGEREDSAAEDDIEALLWALLRKNPEYITSYALLDSQGVTIEDTVVADIGIDRSDRDYFKTFTMHANPNFAYVSPILVSPTSGEAALYFSSPVRAENGDLLGLLRVRYHADVLQQLLVDKNDQAGPGSFGVLFDEYHIHLAHGIEPDVNFIPIVRFDPATTERLIQEQRLPDLPDDELFIMQLDELQEHLSNPETQRFFEATDVATGDLTNQVAIAELETQPWLITFFQPQQIFLAPVAEQARNTLLIALVVALVASGLAVVMSNILVRPITHLTEAVTRFTTGDLETRAKIESRDEIGLLATSFNTMAQQVGSLLTGLEERTDELAHANAEITHLNSQLKDENLRLETELDVVRRLQEMLLPDQQELDRLEPLDIAVYMKPADEVGGDYFDVLQSNGHIKIGIGDVTGHGLESGVLMLMTQMGIRTLTTNQDTDPAHILTVLNRAIYDNVRRMQARKDLSLSLIDYHNGKLRLSGQHEQPILIRADGQLELIDTFTLGFPIGLSDDIAPFVGELELELAPGDGLVLYTDGITEAENDAGEFYGLERLCKAAATYWQDPAESIRQAIINDVYRHIGNSRIYDDITLLVIKQI
jgi:sigma-B regulation protein RsbU (phosphoserine phosphatase)